MAWNSEMNRPNCLRCCEYLRAASNAPCAVPTESAAMEIRPPSKVRRLSTKPSPSLPSNCDCGRRQLLNRTSPVALARMPSLFSFLPTLNPGTPVSRINAEIPCCEAVRSVTAMATQTWAYCALVVNVFPPLSTQQEAPSLTAVERVPAASEPASGSVSDQQPIHSPVANLGRYFCFCSSFPARKIWLEQSEL